MSVMQLLVINPNSSKSITDGLKESLDAITPPETQLLYFTAPAHAPKAISNVITANQTATACYEALVKSGAIQKYDGFLVSCCKSFFVRTKSSKILTQNVLPVSDHPLVHMLREHLIIDHSSKPVVGIFEAAVLHSLVIGHRFAVVSTGHGIKNTLIAGMRAFLGANSERFAGVVTSGIGVVELREGDQTRVERLMKETSAKAAGLGADVLILGCAGMAGMETLVKAGVREAGLGEVRVVDGAKAGVEVLAGLARSTRNT
jgi:Asp/Glu/hydantoin racemase